MKISANHIVGFFILLTLCAATTACAVGNGGRVVSWKEQALLQNGAVLEIDRSIRLGGYDVMYPSNYTEQRISFSMPGVGRKIIWTDPFDKDMGGSSLQPIAVGVGNDDAYVVSSPINCLAYTKWGRPNPPYIVFEFSKNKWEEISIEKLPRNIRQANIVISAPAMVKERLDIEEFTVKKIRELNSRVPLLHLKEIARSQVGPESQITNCPIYTRTKHGGWRAVNPNSGSVK